MKRLVRLTVLSSLVLLQSCYVANMLEFDGLMPAEVTISPSIQSLTVVSRCDLDQAFKMSLQSFGRIKDFNRDSALAKQVVIGCSDAIVESPRFGVFNPVIQRSLAEEFSDPKEKIPWDMVRIIAGDTLVDAVFSLERAEIDDTLKSKVQEGWMTHVYYVYVKSFWRLYRLNDFQSKDFTFIDTVSYYIESPSEFTASPDQKVEMIQGAMYDAGFQVGRRLAPWWTTFQRYFFALGPSDFLEGATLLRKGQWKESAEIWRPYTASSQNQIASKACFNMALTCEMAGNISAALDWLKQSEKLGMHQFYIKEYRSKLETRKSETALLDDQMK